MLGCYSKTEPMLVDCRPPFSFVRLVEIFAGDTRAGRALHGLLGLARKLDATHIVAEELSTEGEVLADQEAATIRCGGKVVTEAFRLSFFRIVETEPATWVDALGNELLGYLVIAIHRLPNEKREIRPYVFESVFIPPSRVHRGDDGQVTRIPVGGVYVHCQRTHTTTIGTTTQNRELSVRGSFFCQQDNLTHVCAHAALRMAINSSPELNSPKLTSARINQILDIDLCERQLGTYPAGHGEPVGLSGAEIEAVIKELGFRTQVARFDSDPNIDYADWIYPLVESSRPVVLMIQNLNTHHALCVVGHTLQSDRWSPEAAHDYGDVFLSKYRASSRWIDHFVVNDDNYGAYAALPADSVRSVLVPKFNPNLHATLGLGIVPDNVGISGYRAEVAASVFLRNLFGKLPSPREEWRFRLSKDVDRMVLRTMLMERDRYLEWLDAVEDQQKRRVRLDEIGELPDCLPERFWLTEVTLPYLFSVNKSKLGDVIVPVEEAEKPVPIFGWLPGQRFIRTPEGGYHFDRWDTKSNVPLIRARHLPLQSSEW